MSFSSWVNKWISQFAHVGWGAFIALSLTCFNGPIRGGLLLVLFASAKEFVFDPLTEDKKLSGGWKGDAIDFLFWLVGGVIGVGVGIEAIRFIVLAVLRILFQ